MSKTNPANIGVGKGGATPIVHGHRAGGRKSAEYKTWLGMKRRCYDIKCKDYPRWGGQGVTVCELWRNSFAAFFEHMGNKPTPEHTIDRLDHLGNYEPGNCRWATQREQGAENRSGLLPVTVNGVEFTSQKAACRHFGVPYTTAHMRIRAGIPVEIAVSTPGRLASRRTHDSYLPKIKRVSA